MSLQRARGLGVWALQWQILQFTNTFEVERWHIMWAFHLNCHLLGTKDMQILRTSTLDRGINTEKNIVFSYLDSPRIKCNQLFVFAYFKISSFNWRYADPFWPNCALNYCTQVCGMCINLNLTAYVYLFTVIYQNGDYKNIHSDLLPVVEPAK